MESNALIGAEIGAFHILFFNLELHRNSMFWESLRAVCIDSVSFEVVPSFSLFPFLFLFSILEFWFGRTQVWFPGLERMGRILVISVIWDKILVIWV